jgi:osmotically inducible protein OsmC
MALSAGLAKGGTPPETLEVTSTVTFDKVGADWTVVSSDLQVTGVVPGLNEAGFAKAAEGAKDGCPISRALKNNVKLSVKSTLAP